jgi:hypothetical protein
VQVPARRMVHKLLKLQMTVLHLSHLTGKAKEQNTNLPGKFPSLGPTTVFSHDYHKQE